MYWGWIKEKLFDSSMTSQKKFYIWQMDLLLKLLQGTLSKSQSIPIYPTFSSYPLSVKPEVSQGFMQLARLFI